MAPETRDTEFAWEDFVERNNPVPSANEGNELVATWGTQSVASRMLRFACKRLDGQVPEPGDPSSSSGQGLDDEDRELLEKAEAGFETVGELYNACKFRAAPSVPSPQLRSPQLRSGQAGQAGQAWARRWPWPARPMATHSLRSPRLRSPQLRSGQAGQAVQAWTARRPGSRSGGIRGQRRRRYESRRACASWTTSKPSWRRRSACRTPPSNSTSTWAMEGQPFGFAQGRLFGTQHVVEYQEETRSHQAPTYDHSGAMGAWTPSALPAGQALREPAPLFKKLDESVVKEEYVRMES